MCKAAQVFIYIEYECVYGICVILLFSGMTFIYVVDGCVYGICAMLLFSGMTVTCLYFYVI